MNIDKILSQLASIRENAVDTLRDAKDESDDVYDIWRADVECVDTVTAILAELREAGADRPDALLRAIPNHAGLFVPRNRKRGARVK